MKYFNVFFFLHFDNGKMIAHSVNVIIRRLRCSADYKIKTDFEYSFDDRRNKTFVRHGWNEESAILAYINGFAEQHHAKVEDFVAKQITL